MDDYKYMKLALIEANKAFNKGEVPVGAIIVNDKRIISKAYNKKEKNNCALEHAEIIAIKKASKKLNNWRLCNSTIYVTLEPCPMCASAIRQSRIKKIVYLFDNKNEYVHDIVDKILSLKDANIPVEKIKLDISLFNENDLNKLSTFFKTRR